MASLKEDDLKKVVSMKMNIIEKAAGVISETRVRLNACSTTEIDGFYTP